MDKKTFHLICNLVFFGTQFMIIIVYFIFFFLHLNRRSKSRKRFIEKSGKTISLETVLSGKVDVFKVETLDLKYGLETWIITKPEAFLEYSHLTFDDGYKIVPEPDDDTIRKICSLHNCVSSTSRFHYS